MSNAYVNKITNNFQDVRLVSLASWRQAGEINPRDRHGPYVVTQLGYDPEDMKMAADEFVLGRSGKWVSMSYFFRMPVPERRAEYLFGTAAEVMQTLQDLSSKVRVLRPGKEAQEAPEPETVDEMLEAFRAAKKQEPGSAA